MNWKSGWAAIAVTGLALLATGCATPTGEGGTAPVGSGFLSNRARDLGEVITLSAETGFANLGCQVGPMLYGVGLSTGEGIGLRSGPGTYHYEDWNTIFVGKRFFTVDSYPRRSKEYSFRSTLGLLPLVICEAACTNRPPSLLDEALTVRGPIGSPMVLGQVEANVCLVVGMRAGLNLGELIDFILGWTTLDLAGDDRHRDPGTAPQPPVPNGEIQP